MKFWKKSTTVAIVASLIVVGTAFATQWLGTTGYDEMVLYQGDDLINMHQGNDKLYFTWGNDEINMGPTASGSGQPETGADIINFYDGDAQLIFHDSTMAPTNKVSMEYEQSTEDLTVYTANDFVIQLGY